MIMSEENQEMEQQFVEIYGEDGQIVKCEIYDVIDFEDKTYALLLLSLIHISEPTRH